MKNTAAKKNLISSYKKLSKIQLDKSMPLATKTMESLG